jgi:hypothetical protein
MFHGFTYLVSYSQSVVYGDIVRNGKGIYVYFSGVLTYSMPYYGWSVYSKRLQTERYYHV